MNTQIKKHVQLLIVAVITAVTVNITYADDLNPAPYRGDQLSVYAKWENLNGGPVLDLAGFNAVDDSDPLTTLDALVPSATALGPDYQFDLPNWIDKMPIKYMRLQVTWLNDPTTPPVLVGLSGVKSGSVVPSSIVFTSPVTPTPIGFYQYYDIVFKPNPDFERWIITSPNPNAQLYQVVADTVSTVPEPATLALLGLGGLLLRKRRR